MNLTAETGLIYSKLVGVAGKSARLSLSRGSAPPSGREVILFPEEHRPCADTAEYEQ